MHHLTHQTNARYRSRDSTDCFLRLAILPEAQPFASFRRCAVARQEKPVRLFVLAKKDLSDALKGLPVVGESVARAKAQRIFDVTRGLLTAANKHLRQTDIRVSNCQIPVDCERALELGDRIVTLTAFTGQLLAPLLKPDSIESMG
jgi:hypothetical protein